MSGDGDKDVDMKVVEEKVADEGGAKEKEPDAKKKQEKDPQTLLVELMNRCLKMMESSVTSSDTRLMGRVVRNLAGVRKTMEPPVLQSLLRKFVDSSRLSLFEDLFNTSVASKGDIVMETSDTKPITFVTTKQSQTQIEFEAFALLVLLLWLIDAGKRRPKEVAASEAFLPAITCAKELAALLTVKARNRRTLDPLQARVYFYYSLACEKSGCLSSIRTELLAAYRTASLRHDAIGQATLLHLLLRNYLHDNLYQQALNLISRTDFPESRPNAQFARFLFYQGQIKAVQLEYSDAHSKLMQAIRKAPTSSNTALGFKLSAHQHAIIVGLLMGGTPDRSTFMQKEFREPLKPYYYITQAVRDGDLTTFTRVVQEYERSFVKDQTLTLVNRLRYNVIKTGLRRISLAYSRISLEDIKTKLGLESKQAAAGVVAKAVVDGVIDASIDYESEVVTSGSKNDIYSSSEPQKALHKRISFCLNMHTDVVRAMAYPDEHGKEQESAEQREEKEKEKKQLLVDSAEDEDDDMGML